MEKAVSLFLLLSLLLLSGVEAKRLPIEMGIDGNPHFFWDAAHIAVRKPLGNIVARMYFPPERPLSFMDEHVLIAVRDVGTRVHALIGRTEYDVDANAYASYAAQVVQRFGPKGSFWNEHPEINRNVFSIKSVELMNEPYFVSPVSPQRYASYIAPALKAIKALKSGVRVIVGTANYARKNGNKWLDTLYKVIPKLNSYVDGFATHPYWNGHAPNQKTSSSQRPFSRLDSLRAAINCHGGEKKGIYITEYGGSTATQSGQGVSEAQQAQHLKAFLKAATQNTYGWNVRMFLVYTIQDWPQPDLKNRESLFGIVRPDGSQKPSYAIVKKYLGVSSIPVRPLKSSYKGHKILGACKKWTR